jgi:nicotinamidase-related amidase
MAPSVVRTRPSSTAIVLVDVQERLVAAMPPGRMRDLERAARILLGAARELGAPVLLTEQYPQGLGRTAAPLAEWLAAAGIRPIEKLAFSACLEPAFVEALEQTGAEAAVVLGMETHVCVFQTARDLVERGLRVAVPMDGVVSRRDDHRQVGLDLCAAAGAVVTTAETLLFDWMVQSGTDTFRTLSRLVR